MKIVQIVVLYNKKIKNDSVDKYYFDNSTDPLIIEHNKQYNSVFSMGGNKGLSVVYNLAIEMFADTYDYLQILDDDSRLEENFIEKFKMEVELLGVEYDYYLPTIISLAQNKKKYPVYKADNIFLKCINLFIKNTKDIKTINSGLIINLKNNPPKYDENLFLYCVDYEYSRRVIKNSMYKILDLKLYQNFSLRDTDIEKVKRRYRMIVTDGKKYYTWPSYYVNYTLIYLNLSIRYKTFKFLPEIIKL